MWQSKSKSLVNSCVVYLQVTLSLHMISTEDTLTLMLPQVMELLPLQVMRPTTRTLGTGLLLVQDTPHTALPAHHSGRERCTQLCSAAIVT